MILATSNHEFSILAFAIFERNLKSAKYGVGYGIFLRKNVKIQNGFLYFDNFSEKCPITDPIFGTFQNRHDMSWKRLSHSECSGPLGSIRPSVGH